MALRGNLRDFSLPDVFQLVTFSRKTGVLRIRREDGAEGSVWFRDGDVFFASSNWHAEFLGERLVKAQRITPQALARALAVRAEEPEAGRRLGQILIDEGYITDKVLETFVSEQIQDTIFDLMRWDEGDFDFEAMPEVVDEDIGLSVSIENVVMEGSRRLEEWTRIRKKIPSMDVVFKMATAPGEGTFEISLKPMEWQLLLLIDGTRSVADLAVETRRTDFDVARIIYGLFSAGLLEFATEEEIENNRKERAEREARLAEIAEAQAARDAEAARQAQEREQRLVAEAAARKAAEEEAAAGLAAQAQLVAKAAPVAEPEAEQYVHTEPEEMPEFLESLASTHTADDQAVLAEFMGAVLDHHVADAPAEPEPEAPASVEPYVPAEEPAFMSADVAVEPSAGITVSSVEQLLGLEVAPPPPVAPVEAEPLPEWLEAEEVASAEPVEDLLADIAHELGVRPEPELEASVDVELEPASEYAVSLESEPEAEVESPGLSLESDLMALGLGELPAGLLEPIETQSEVPEVISAAEIETSTPFQIEPSAEVIAEPDFLEPVSEPMSEIDMSALEINLGAPSPLGDTAPGERSPIDEIGSLIGELELPLEIPVELAAEAVESAPEPDFSELLQSLDVDAPVQAAAEAEGFDEELLLDADDASEGGVISTDAFLDDISVDDMGFSFSGGLTDELSALTGVERKQNGRPQASVNELPDTDSPVLTRDARVDRDTLLKIIDGIKNL